MGDRGCSHSRATAVALAENSKVVEALNQQELRGQGEKGPFPPQQRQSELGLLQDRAMVPATEGPWGLWILLGHLPGALWQALAPCWLPGFPLGAPFPLTH